MQLIKTYEELQRYPWFITTSSFDATASLAVTLSCLSTRKPGWTRWQRIGALQWFSWNQQRRWTQSRQCCGIGVCVLRCTLTLSEYQLVLSAQYSLRQNKICMGRLGILYWCHYQWNVSISNDLMRYSLNSICLFFIFVC